MRVSIKFCLPCLPEIAPRNRVVDPTLENNVPLLRIFRIKFFTRSLLGTGQSTPCALLLLMPLKRVQCGFSCMDSIWDSNLSWLHKDRSLRAWGRARSHSLLWKLAITTETNLHAFRLWEKTRKKQRTYIGMGKNKKTKPPINGSHVMFDNFETSIIPGRDIFYVQNNPFISNSQFTKQRSFT